MTTKEEKHFETCSAPFCRCDTTINKDSVVWYAGESVCSWKPEDKIQQRQQIINKHVKNNSDFKKIHYPYTMNYLLKHSA